MASTYDIVVIGSGVGGSAAALRLAASGLSVLVLERGVSLPREAENWSAEEVFVKRRYIARDEAWSFNGGAPELPLAYYNVGGASKLFGGVLIRLRERDFDEIAFPEGVSPAWPVTYADLEPYYDVVEGCFGVHGLASEDPTEPPRKSPFPFPPIAHDDRVAGVIDGLRTAGLKPFHLPLSLQQHPGGNCIRCGTCDGYPCRVDAKGDAEVSLLNKALAYANITLWTQAKVERLRLESDGDRISHIEGTRGGSPFSVSAKVVILAAGAINSAALLLRSADGRFKAGLANSSGMVGRNYMAHNSSVLMAFAPRRMDISFQKTFGINDYYFGDAAYPYPMGNAQMIGKLQAAMIAGRTPYLPNLLRREAVRHSIDWYLQSEDLPDPASRVTVGTDGRIRIDRQLSNLEPHRQLVARISTQMKRLGFPLVMTETLGAKTTSHQCGTVRMGHDPATAPLDPYCRSHDHTNLFVVDASFFPSSAGVNPALTVAAQSMRVVDHMLATDFR
ncbi:MAG TPA: GMC family oxidoreductase [Terriglobales bacterium]|nr:GMC family oxidoreductase [Terriglobales bacterium]